MKLFDTWQSPLYRVTWFVYTQAATRR